MLLTDELVGDRIERFLSEDKFTEVLKLEVEEMDEKDLREAENKRKEREYRGPTIEEQQVGKGGKGGAKPKKSKEIS